MPRFSSGNEALDAASNALACQNLCTRRCGDAHAVIVNWGIGATRSASSASSASSAWRAGGCPHRLRTRDLSVMRVLPGVMGE